MRLKWALKPFLVEVLVPTCRGAQNKKLTPSWLQSKMVSEAKRGFLLGEAKRGLHFCFSRPYSEGWFLVLPC